MLRDSWKLRSCTKKKVRDKDSLVRKKELMVRKESTKKLSKVSKVLMAGWSIPQAKAATAAVSLVYQTPHTGISYIYSNNPESLPAGNACTIEKYLSTANANYDVEFYHSVPTGGASRKVGVAIQNLTGSAATITIYAESVAIATSGQAAGPAAGVELAYQKQLTLGTASITTIDLPSNQSVMVIPSNINSTINAGQTIIGKIRLSSNIASVKLRIFYGTPANASTVFTYAYAHYITFDNPPASNAYNGKTIGYFSHDALATSVDFSQGQSSFVLPRWSRTNPPPTSEYEAAENYSAPHDPHGPSGPQPTGDVVLGGNYGMVYQITIAHASGKKLHISGAGSFVAQAPGNNWYSYTSFPQIFDITSDSWLFKFIQPGGNSSNFTFEIS
jgi:hypothetical protein